MEQHRSRWREVSGRRAAMGDQALVAALRCQDDVALREFFLRFRPSLLRTAAQLGVSPDERDAMVDDCLADVAVHLIGSNLPPPRSLPAYLARSLRNRVLNCARATARAERRVAEPAAEDGAHLAACSEHAVRSSGGAPSPRSVPPALRRLAEVLEGELASDEERLLAVWLSHCVPSQQIAAWLGIGHKAAAKRIERLRERLQLAALRHLETTDGDVRNQLLIFLGRASLAPRSAARLAAVRGAAEVRVP